MMCAHPLFPAPLLLPHGTSSLYRASFTYGDFPTRHFISRGCPSSATPCACTHRLFRTAFRLARRLPAQSLARTAFSERRLLTNSAFVVRHFVSHGAFQRNTLHAQRLFRTTPSHEQRLFRKVPCPTSSCRGLHLSSHCIFSHKTCKPSRQHKIPFTFVKGMGGARRNSQTSPKARGCKGVRPRRHRRADRRSVKQPLVWTRGQQPS